MTFNDTFDRELRAKSELESLRVRCEQAEADTTRLDWLEKHRSNPYEALKTQCDENYKIALRAAIDAARATTAKETQMTGIELIAAEREPMHEKIFRVAMEWCAKNPQWTRICDLPQTDFLYKTWKELPHAARRSWERDYGSSAESAWREFGRAPCKVQYGFIGTDGVFYPQITDVPININSCQVFKITPAEIDRLQRREKE